ncbi:MAG: sodium:solute symporter family protein [Candidatus Eutrophobiaceae bacterium]
MNTATLSYIVVGASFMLYIGIAFATRASSISEFYIAGKSVGPIQNGMATAADWMSAASFISMAGLISFMGYGGSVFLIGWTGGFVLLSMLLAPYMRKFGSFTVSEFIGERYYGKIPRVAAVGCLLIVSITYIIGQMKGVGVAFSRFMETSYEIGLFTGMAIVFLYAVVGGMKSITYTQIAQYCILVFAYTLPAIFISLQLTGNPIPQLGLGGSLTDGSLLLDKLDQVVRDLGFDEYTSSKRISTLNMLAYTLSLMLGTAGLPHVIMRFFTVPRVRDARATAGWTLLFVAILYTTAPAIAAMARLNIIQTIQPGEVGSPSGNLVYEERPEWFRNWETTGLLQFQDKNGDGRIQYYNDDNPEFSARAAQYGWKGNEMIKMDRDIIVLANPEIAQLPPWVIAFVVAGGLAAALSTAAGLLLAIASAISHDLIKGVLRPQISARNELLTSRLSMAGAIALAGYLGLNPPGFAAGTVALAFGLAASSIFPSLFLGIFYKRLNKAGAVSGMLAGIGVTLFYVFQHKGIFFIPEWTYLTHWGENWFLGIEPNAFGVIGALVNFAVALSVCRFTAPPPERVQRMVEELRIPGKIHD